MKRYVQLAAIWLALGFGLIVLLVGVFGRQLNLQAVQKTSELKDVGLKIVIVWASFGLIMGGLGILLSRSRYYFKLLDTYARVVNSALLIGIMICALKIGFEMAPGYANLSVAQKLQTIFGPLWSWTSVLLTVAHVPARFGSIHTAPILVASLFVLGRAWVNWGMRENMRGADTAVLPQAGGQRGARVRDADAQKRAQAAHRKVAVASYTEAKAMLAQTEMHLTFLSMDVVGSTKMKQGEDPYVIEQAFADYRVLVERSLRKHNAYKQTWTPDGQMAAFKEPQEALDCAKAILLALPDFNANVSKMKTPFQLRTGANCGVVSTDDATPMEKMSDFTIDVAGHMQKYADYDSCWMSEAVFEKLVDRTGVEPNGQEVDTRKVYVWRRDA